MKGLILIRLVEQAKGEVKILEKFVFILVIYKCIKI